METGHGGDRQIRLIAVPKTIARGAYPIYNFGKSTPPFLTIDDENSQRGISYVASRCF